jgi:hypothetical protein
MMICDCEIINLMGRGVYCKRRDIHGTAFHYGESYNSICCKIRIIPVPNVRAVDKFFWSLKLLHFGRVAKYLWALPVIVA